MTSTSSIDTNLQEKATELMPAVTMTNTEQLINGFLYLVPVTISLPERLAYPTVLFKTCWSIYARAVIQFIAYVSQMYNLQTQLRSTVIDSPVKVTPVCVCVFISLFFGVFFSTGACVALSKQIQSK